MPKSAKKKKVNFKKYFLHYLSCLAVVLILTVTTLNLNKFLSAKKVLGAQIDNSKVIAEKSYWLDVVKTNPTYLDGYLELAKVDAELNLKDEAENYIRKAYSLQPNSTKIPEVSNLLGL